MPTDLTATTSPATECEKDFREEKGTLTTRSANITSLEAALSYSKVDLTEWEVERHVINSWEVTISGKRSSSKKDKTYTNYQVKVWLKRRQPTAAENAVEQFRKLVAAHVPKKFIRPPRIKSGGYLYELGITDIHLGKLAHSGETGWRNYDSKIAAADYRTATDALLARAPHGTEEVLIILGNDQFNADNAASTTTAGTPQDCDGRFSKVYRLGVNLSIEAIEKALHIAPVRVVIVPGNHDHLTAWHLGEVLRAYFRNNKHVTVENEATPRKYVHFGTNLLGFTHGDRKSELKALPNLMAREMRHVWNTVRHTEWHVGHFHSQKLIEVAGVVVRTLSALCPPEAWHSENGYVGSREGAQGFAFHRTRGLEETFCHNIVSEPLRLVK